MAAKIVDRDLVFGLLLGLNRFHELFGMCNELFDMFNELLINHWHIQVFYFVNYIFANYIFCVGVGYRYHNRVVVSISVELMQGRGNYY